MAMTCVCLGKECDGCMACQDAMAAKTVFWCCECGCRILEDDVYYDFDGDLYCEDCVNNKRCIA